MSNVTTLDNVRKFKAKQENAKRLREARAMQNYLTPEKYGEYLREHGIAVKADGTLFIPRSKREAEIASNEVSHQVFVAEALAELEDQ